jgi:phage tail-like protein
MARMGLQFGLETNLSDPSSVSKTCLRKFRWLFEIDGISASGIQSLPPSQAARPSVSFSESEVRHLNENYYYPAKPDWKPVNLILFDIVKSNSAGGRLHPVFEWMKKIYDPKADARWQPAADGFITGFTREARLKMLDGCGNVIETWFFENAWPQAIDFGTLDMANNEIVTCDITLRYARAYIEN